MKRGWGAPPYAQAKVLFERTLIVAVDGATLDETTAPVHKRRREETPFTAAARERAAVPLSNSIIARQCCIRLASA